MCIRDSVFLRNVRDDDWNTSTHTFPVAKGDHFLLHNRGQTQGGQPCDLKVWRRDMGHAAP